MTQNVQQLSPEIQAKIASNAVKKNRQRTALPSFDNIDPADSRVATAKELSAKSSNVLVVRYIRSEPRLSKVTNAVTGKTDYVFQRGEPLATMVAFMHNGKAYFGWSKRHPKDEPLMFTKDRARYAAILRGLTDSVTLTGSKTSVTNSTGKYIPGIIAKQIPAFLDKASKYFDADFANVSV